MTIVNSLGHRIKSEVGRRQYWWPKQVLFEYRIRKVYDKWHVICSHDETIVCSSFLEAAIRGETLKNQGYVDGDR